MSWADHAIKELKAGREVSVRPRGNSMTPKVRSGALCVLEPVNDPASLTRGEIVLVKVRGNVYLHLVSATDPERVQISNNRGHTNGWTARANVFGRLQSVDNSDCR